MNITIEHPMKTPNFTIVEFGETPSGGDGRNRAVSSIAFSYQTVIGVRVGFERWKVTENYWGPTTGKHLNYLNSEKSERLGAEEFASLLGSVKVEML